MSKRPIRLLITDLDNTLYDWVTFFARSFDAMSRELSSLLNEPEDVILDDFKLIHQKHGNSEQPFAILDLPTVKRHFPDDDRSCLLGRLARPLQVFNESRRENLKLYGSVENTFRSLRSRGVRIVGHTEAIAVNALYRLRTLGILEYFERLYALEGRLTPHPDPNWKPAPLPKPNFVTEVPLSERKPNPALLHDICRHEGVSPNEAWYVGDSLTRDIAMARAAGITAAWAKYGTQYDPALWRVLVRVTHWSAEDVAREAELKKLASQVQPDFSLDAYSDILKYAELPPQESDLS